MSYNNVMPGKLNLKGGLPAPAKKIRKKKPNEEPKKPASAEPPPTVASAPLVAAPPSPPEQKTEKNWEDTLTPSERKFLEVQRKREKETITKAAAEPHKKKVEKLNQYLDSLPVHFDIPKVGPG